MTDVNYDAGEQIGWPAYVEQMQTLVRESEPARLAGPPDVFIGHNYGIAGAWDRYGRSSSSTALVAYSGHNGYWYWGPPPAGTDTAITAGYDGAFLREQFAECGLLGVLDNGLGLDNDEQGEQIYLCAGPRADWETLWDRFKNIG